MTETMDQTAVPFNAAYRQVKTWAIIAGVIIACQFGVIFYGMNLPGAHQWLSIPWLICTQLTLIPIFEARHTMKKHLRKMEKQVVDNEAEYYRMLTGENR